MSSSVEVTLQNSPISLEMYTGGQPGPRGDPGEIVFPVPTVESELNLTDAVLGVGESFVGEGEQNSLPDVFVAARASHACTLYIEFSPDGINWDQTLTYLLAGDNPEQHRAVKGGRWFRVRVDNNVAGVPLTYLRMRSYFGSFSPLTRPANSTVFQDTDALVVRAVPQDADLLSGRLEGLFVIAKYGRNPDLDTAGLPEDFWNGGGPYTGFPVGPEAACEAFSTSASDTGVLQIQGLRTPTSEYSVASYQLTGTTPVNIGSWYRINRGNYDNGNPTSSNVGSITARRVATPADVFFLLPPTFGQTAVGVWTVPAGYTGFLKRLTVEVFRSNAGVIEGCIWIRPFGKSPRLTRFFSASNTINHVLDPAYGIPLPPLTDVTIRCLVCTANNTVATAEFDILHVRD